jgi:hypothetical protein
VSTATPSTTSQGGGSRLKRGLRLGASDVARNKWAERAARLGIIARGIVFVLLAYLLARIALGALGHGGGTRNSVSGPGVADAVAEQTGGRAALVLLGIGLVLYALFSLLETIRGPLGESSELKRWSGRLQSLFGFGLYGAFAVYCFHIAAASPSSGGTSAHANRQQSQWSAKILRWPAGWLWLGLLGVIIFALAGYQAYKAVRRTFMDDVEQGRMSRRARQLAEVLGVVGHLARGATFGLVAWFVMEAAVENDPQKGKGFDGSARMLASSSGGPYLIWVLAIGLAVFGLYLFVESRYRKV